MTPPAVPTEGRERVKDERCPLCGNHRMTPWASNATTGIPLGWTCTVCGIALHERTMIRARRNLKAAIAKAVESLQAQLATLRLAGDGLQRAMIELGALPVTVIDDGRRTMLSESFCPNCLKRKTLVSNADAALAVWEAAGKP